MFFFVYSVETLNHFVNAKPFGCGKENNNNNNNISLLGLRDLNWDVYLTVSLSTIDIG